MSSIQPQVYDHSIRRNRSYEKTFYFTDTNDVALNLSSYTITAQIKKELKYSSDVIASFTVDVSDAANGNITVSFTTAETKAITEAAGYWDMLFELGTDIESWVEGKVEFKETITNVS